MPWIEAQDVADQLDIEVDDRLSNCTAAIKSEVERLRSDLDFSGSVEIPASIVYAAILWAAILYQHRSAPSGFAGYGDGADVVGDVIGSRKADLYRLLGLRRPVTA